MPQLPAYSGRKLRPRIGRALRVAVWLVLVACVGLACSRGGGSGGGDAEAKQRAQVLSRTAYGHDAWSRQRIESLGVDAYLEEQLDPASLTENPELVTALASYPSLSMTFAETLQTYQAEPFQPLFELLHARVLRSVLSRRQLEQLLVDFWFNHFNVFGADGFTNFAVGPFERDAIRPFVLGRFEDMLRATARSPAMLYYLDNYLSSRDGFVFEGEERGLNENYARELLELHTLGVDAGYDQTDVIEVARALTGWTIGPPLLADPDGFFFWSEAHDDAAKSIMGELFLPAGGGVQDGLDLIAFLAAHPNTARFLCTKLTMRLVSESAPASAVDDCEDAYLSSQGDLREATGAILASKAFRGGSHASSKVKRPLVFLAGLARATELPLTPDLLNGIVFYSGLLGEGLYQARPPTGHPDDSEHWAAGGTLISRFNLVSAITAGDTALGIDWGVQGGTHEEVVDALIDRLFAAPIDPSTRRTAIQHVEALGGAPDPVRVREAATVLLASPDFMRH